MTESNTTPPAPLAVEALPVVTWWYSYRDYHEYEGSSKEDTVGYMVDSFSKKQPAVSTNNYEPLVRRSDAEAQLSTLRAEIERLCDACESWNELAATITLERDAALDQVAWLERERDAERDWHRNTAANVMALRAELEAPKAATRPIRTHGALPPPGAQTTPLPPFGPHPATQMRGGDPLDVERVMKLADKVATRFHTFVKPGSTIEDGALWEAAREALRSALAGE